MDPNEFKSTAAGELIKNLDGNWCFVPAPLPPKIDWTDRLVSEVATATLAIGHLRGLGRKLPNPHRLIRMFLRREAEFSSRIENTFANIESMLLFEQLPSIERMTPDVQEVLNNFKTLEFAVASAEHRPISVSLIKEMHAILLQDVRGHDKSPGKFRQVQAHIGRSARIDDARFVPAPPHAIDPCMEDLEQYLATNDGLPVVIRAALVHYHFETIHPFADGNGRVGRALLLLQLVREGALPAPLLNPSAQLEHQRDAYYDGLLAVSQRGEWTQWLEFFVAGLTIEAREAARRIERFETLRETYRQAVTIPRASALLFPLIDELLAEPAITNMRVRSLFNIADSTAQNLLDRLEELQIVREVTGQRRNRVYLAQGVVDLFTSNPETEPK